MLLNCEVGEDSWESLGLQGDPTSPFWRRSALGFLWKDWCWSWNSSTLATCCEEPTHWKRSWSGKDWRQEEKSMTEDEMVEWHHWLDGSEFEQAPGVGDGQEGLACFVHAITKSQTWLSDWTELIVPHLSPVMLTEVVKFFEFLTVLASKKLASLNSFLWPDYSIININHPFYKTANDACWI